MPLVNSWKLLTYVKKSSILDVVKSEMVFFIALVNGWKPSTYITKSSIFDVAGVLNARDCHITNNYGRIVKNYVSSRNRLVQTSTKVGIRSYWSKTAF